MLPSSSRLQRFVDKHVCLHFSGYQPLTAYTTRFLFFMHLSLVQVFFSVWFVCECVCFAPVRPCASLCECAFTRMCLSAWMCVCVGCHDYFSCSSFFLHVTLGFFFSFIFFSFSSFLSSVAICRYLYPIFL